MGRNAGVVRQWTILRTIETARAGGVTIDELSSRCGVTTRTIRRDLQALEESGFPLFDDRSADDGRTRWRLNGTAFKAVAAGLTLSELCALYFSRTLLESLAGTAFRANLEQAFDKLAAGLTPHMRVFLDRLPQVIATKSDPQRRRSEQGKGSAALIARALEATLHSREATLTYHSKSSERTKVYRVHPYRLAYAQGGLYLLAYVPEYDEVRTFAMERVESLSLLEERFTPPEDLPDRAFPHSLGVHSGPAERIELAFTREAAGYVRAREWHPSQTLRDLPDGGVLLTLDVCRDQALRSWILSFGASAQVLSPETLARETAEQFAQAQARYMVRLGS